MILKQLSQTRIGLAWLPQTFRFQVVETFIQMLPQAAEVHPRFVLRLQEVLAACNTSSRI